MKQKLLILISFILLSGMASGQELPGPAGSYLTLYDYSNMKDTVIIDRGYYEIGSGAFHKTIAEPAPAFGKREITVRNRRLKKVYIIDRNYGITLTYLYNRNGLRKIKQGRCEVSNAPHFW